MNGLDIEKLLTELNVVNLIAQGYPEEAKKLKDSFEAHRAERIANGEVEQ